MNLSEPTPMPFLPKDKIGKSSFSTASKGYRATIPWSWSRPSMAYADEHQLIEGV